MNLQQTIEAISKKTGKDMETLKKEVEGFYNEAKTLYSDKDEAFLQGVAKDSLTAAYRKKLISGGYGSKYNAVFVGYSDFDNAKNIRRFIEEEYKKDPEAALKAKMVNMKGEPLYWVPTDEIAAMQDWQKKKLGNVIPETDIRRTIKAVSVQNGNMIELELTLGSTCWDREVKLYTNVSFTASAKSNSQPDHIKLYGTRDIDFVYGKPLTEQEVEAILTGFFKAKNITFANMEAYSQTEAAQQFGNFIVNKVKVVDIIPTLAKNGQRMIRIQDESLDIIDEKGEIIPPVRCFVPAEIPVDYTERAYVYVLGRVTKDNQTGKFSTMNVYGIYTLNVYKDLKKSLPVESEPVKKPESFTDAF